MEIIVKIEGIHCGGCINRIDIKLSELGVDRFDLDLSTRTAHISFDTENVSTTDILGELRHLGYRPFLQPSLESHK